MKENVTKISPPFPDGESPNYIIPDTYTDYRYALGRIGNNPIVTICMNPSAANEQTSDRTINTIIKISKALNYDGWVVFNLYPERATNASNIVSYNEEWSENNVNIIIDFLIQKNIKEVFGAWGNDNGIESLVKGKQKLLITLKAHNIKVYYFGTLTKSGNPRHILQRQEKRDLTKKSYINF